MIFLLALLWALVFAAVILFVVVVWDRIVRREERSAMAQLKSAAERQRGFEAEKQAAVEHRILLAREVDHRAKNLLAVVQSILVSCVDDPYDARAI